MRFLRVALTLMIILLQPECVFAGDPVTDWVYITQLRAGLVLESMAVYTTGSFVAVPGCKSGAGYATDPNDPGHKLFHTMLLSAYLNHKQVQLTLQNCAFEKPRIIGVFIKD